LKLAARKSIGIAAVIVEMKGLSIKAISWLAVLKAVDVCVLKSQETELEPTE